MLAVGLLFLVVQQEVELIFELVQEHLMWLLFLFIGDPNRRFNVHNVANKKINYQLNRCTYITEWIVQFTKCAVSNTIFMLA